MMSDLFKSKNNKGVFNPWHMVELQQHMVLGSRSSRA